MSDALREQVLAAAVTALNTGAPGGTPTAERARTDTLDRDNLDALLLYPARDVAGDVGGRAGPLRRREFTFIVECWGAETDALTADQRATELTAWVIEALEDSDLGGIVNTLREVETDYELDIGEVSYCLAVVTMVAEYQHRAGDLTART